MTRYITPLAAALALIFTSGTALAEQSQIPSSGPVPFATVDSDGDGYISEKEFTHMRNERVRMRTEEGRMMRNMGNAPQFGDIDTDGDGRISQEEYQHHQQIRMEQRMQQRGGMGPGGGMGSGSNTAPDGSTGSGRQ